MSDMMLALLILVCAVVFLLWMTSGGDD